MISQQTIDRVFSDARIEEVVGDFVVLKRAGANYKGLSPFNDEKTPSFVVSPAKGIWKDFSSGKGGNMVTFVMEVEHCTYPEAIRYIAKKYNIEIEETEVSPEVRQAADERESLYVVTEYAAGWFKKQLHETAAGRNIGLTYFRQRGFSDATIEKFTLGYSPEAWSAFSEQAIKDGYNPEYLETTGLSIKREDGRYNDRFRGRVVFPIHSFSGRVAGFGARTMQSEKTIAKYLNSPESPIYHKSDILYGLFQAKNAIVKQDSCYLVEGYTDVISLHQAGVENVVASSGTSLTDGQIRLVKRLTQNITVLYDGDMPGIKASFRGIDMLLAADMNVRVLTFPDDDDPDSFARKHTAEELKEYLEKNRTDFIDFKARLLLDEAAGDPILKSRLVRDIVVSISKISDYIKREVYLREASRIMDVSESSLFRELAQIDSRNRHEYEAQAKRAADNARMRERLTVEKTEQTQVDPFGSIERDMLRIMLLYGDVEVEMEEVVREEEPSGSVREHIDTYRTTIAREIMDSLAVDGITLRDKALENIYDSIKAVVAAGNPIDPSELLKADDPEVIGMVSSLISEDYQLAGWDRMGVPVRDFTSVAAAYTRDIVLRYREAHVKAIIADISAQLADPQTAPEDLDSLKQTLMRLTEIRRRLNEELGGRVV